MLPNIARALALGCVGVALSACNTTTATQVTSGLTAGAITAAQITPAALAAAGATPTQIQKAAAVLKQARDTAVALCGIEPSVASVANIIAAAAGGSAAILPATQVANIACTALTGKSTYTAGTAPEKPAVKKSAPALKAGDSKKGVVIVTDPDGNQIPITVNGTVVDPKKAK
ncbi:hypothetical protein MKK88_00995 [Methylobacterium sp. E-005]|uniref:hypothetical protein n=1 Tax=Methylobacterium sp. E-005 TaxID=2836549 RepID=UPI001FB9CC3A|nr:hypothetical protein [Methylobacterium sp. E-005]MCJ2084572.1 hypothetical protein [Methylobacterium sp. E-005]